MSKNFEFQDLASFSQSLSTKDKPKLGRACDMCYTRKIKCDKVTPSCQNCSKSEIPCTYYRAEKQSYNLGRPTKLLKMNSSEDKKDKKQRKKIEIVLSSPYIPKINEMQNAKFTIDRVLNPMPKNEPFLFQFSDYSLGKSLVLLSDNGEGFFFGNSPASYALSSNPYALKTLLMLVKDSEYQKSLDKNTKKTNVKKFLQSDTILSPNQKSNMFSLISPEMTYKLIELYFYHFNSGYSLLNRKVFDDWMNTNNGENIQFLFSSVLMTASGYLNIKSHAPRLGTLFATNSNRLLKNLYTTPSLATIQGLIIMSHYPSIIMDDSTAQYGWSYHFTAVRMAYDLGLHLPAPNLPHHLQEVRRRTMWNLFGNDILFRLCVGKMQLIRLEEITIAFPQLNEYLDSSEQWFNKSWPSNPSPLRRIKSYEVRIIFFKLAYRMLNMHRIYKEKLKPFSLSNCTMMPLGWNLSKTVVSLPIYSEFLSQTIKLESKLHEWYLSHHPLRCRRVPKADQNSIIVPHKKDMYAFLGSLHYLYLLLELFRPHFILDTEFTKEDAFSFYSAVLDPENLPINKFTKLSANVKPLVVSYIAGHYIIERRCDFFHIGVPYKWWWLFNFYLTLNFYLERPYKENNPVNNDEINEYSKLVLQVSKMMSGLYKILMEGADRYVLANDFFSVLKMYPVANNSPKGAQSSSPNF